MYRGIWLPAGISEDAIRYQYSFQSFSRSVAGVMKVLRFYSGVQNTTTFDAAFSGRMLMYIGRGWADSPWVVPVQLFDGPKAGNQESEEELLLPPFVVYQFEDDLSIDPDTSSAEK